MRAPVSVEVRVVVAFFALLAALPLVVSNEYVLFIGTQLWVYFAVALGLNFLAGYGGQVSLGNGARPVRSPRRPSAA